MIEDSDKPFIERMDNRFAYAWGTLNAPNNWPKLTRDADSDEDAQAFRFDGALDSDMMSPRTGASLAGDWWHR